uniref:Aminopeptidase P family protein n=1 Tax=Thermorudis peleae TaxID=1382356 RepID=A0A831T6J6_9BACT
MTGPIARRVFTDQEFARRWQSLRRILTDHQVDLAVLVDADTIYYLTGFAGSGSAFQALLVPMDNEPVHLLRYTEELSFLSTSWLDVPAFYNDWDNPVVLAARLARKLVPRLRRVGIEKASYHLAARRYEQLMAEWPGALGVDLSDAIGWLRLVKSPEEIEQHRQAAIAVQRGLETGVAAVRAGVREREIAAALAGTLVRAGADTLFPGTIVSGERLRDVDGRLGDRTLQHGDLVRMEMTNSVNRYWARLTRMVSVGPPSAEMAELYEQVRLAQEEQIARLVPGAIPSELDAFVRSKLPIGLWTMQLSGYALACHECRIGWSELDRFWIVRDEYRPLAAGMVFHMVLTAGPGLSVGDTVVVTEQGGRYLTTYPRDLIVVE